MRKLFLVGAVASLALSGGCAHQRQVYYPASPAQPVQVRAAGSDVKVCAPFVNVQVHKDHKDELEDVDTD